MAMVNYLRITQGFHQQFAPSQFPKLVCPGNNSKPILHGPGVRKGPSHSRAPTYKPYPLHPNQLFKDK
jgi:hypothetical protein